MTNYERIKQMSLFEMKNFLWRGVNCNEYCPDHKAGCGHHCPHNAGKDIIEKWLNEEADNDKTN